MNWQDLCLIRVFFVELERFLFNEINYNRLDKKTKNLLGFYQAESKMNRFNSIYIRGNEKFLANDLQTKTKALDGLQKVLSKIYFNRWK